MNAKQSWTVARCNSCGSADVALGGIEAERDELREQVRVLREALQALVSTYDVGNDGPNAWPDLHLDINAARAALKGDK